MICTISGSKNNIKLICTVAKHLLPTLEASLYSNLKFIDIRTIENPILSGHKYITKPQDAGDRLQDMDFKKDGNYLDPMLDILSLFNQVINNSLVIQYCFDFDTKHTLVKKI